MLLQNVEIISFRSIIGQHLNCVEGAIALLGLNESGKTNAIKAIRFLNDDYSFSIKDKPKFKEELPSVRYTFSLVQKEIDDCLNICNNIISEYLNESENKPIAKLEIDSFIYTLFLKEEKSKISKYKDASYRLDLSLEKDLYKLSEDVSETIEALKEDRVIIFNTKNYYIREDIPTEHLEKFIQLKLDDIRKLLHEDILEFLLQNIPKVIFWEYDDTYLLPSEVSYSEFIAGEKPYYNIRPLYNIFKLSRRLSIKTSKDLIERINRWKIDSSERRKDSSVVSEDVNQFIKEIWPENDQIIRLELEETKITIHVIDKKSDKYNYYEMEARSQGFKTFISFMLTIATEFDRGTISNSILVLDEPETHLHPSGVRYMRDELIKLSERNRVIYATHSIFMIDRANLKRHVIVKKDEEETRLEPIKRNQILHEKVIYEALGTRLDEFAIKLKNIVFEGETDLILFSKYFEYCIEKVNYSLDDYEFLDGGGTTKIQSYLKDHYLQKESKWYIILDSDSAGISFNKFIKGDSRLKPMVECVFYSEEKDIELEDLLPEGIIRNTIDATCDYYKLNIQEVFMYSGTNNFSKRLSDFKRLNSITIKFDDKFKELLAYYIEQDLKEIVKQENVQSRLKWFSERYPLYNKFIEELIAKFKKAA